MGVPTAADGDHAAGGPVGDEVDGDVRERGGDHLVEGVRVAAPQVVRQLADDRILSAAALDLPGQRLADVDLAPMTEPIRLAELVDLRADPRGTLRDDDERVAARIRAFVRGEERDDPLKVERIVSIAIPLRLV